MTIGKSCANCIFAGDVDCEHPNETCSSSLEFWEYKKPTDDKINHPSHYASGKIECVDAMEEVCAGLQGMEAVFTGNILKYIWRWKKKNGIEDLRKAKWYLERLIKQLEGGDV